MEITGKDGEVVNVWENLERGDWKFGTWMIASGFIGVVPLERGGILKIGGGGFGGNLKSS
jgi:hypothetical protein